MNKPAEVFNQETGEMIDADAELQEGGEAGEEGIQENLLDAIARESDDRIRRIAPKTMDDIKAIREKGVPIAIGVMGWFSKVSAQKKGNTILPGSRLVGQIVSTLSTKGKFGSQQAVIIYGRYQCPKHVNNQRQVIQAADKIGRWIVGIDSTLSELPACIGEVISIEIERAAQPGSGQRHAYKHVDIYQESAGQ